MERKNSLYCNTCGTVYPLDSPRWQCSCGGLLQIDWHYTLDLGRVSDRRFTMWRYREAYPVSDDAAIVSFREGFPPLLRMPVQGTQGEGAEIYIKQDHLFQSGSYKDRGASVLLSKVRELGITYVVEDSSGNAGCAIASYAAAAGIRSDIYVPATAPPPKIAQIQAYGAHTVSVPGNRDAVAEAVAAYLTKNNPPYYAGHAWNPFFLHGTKSFAFEVCEQLGWRAPDTVCIPTGNGTLLLGASLGFSELMEQGIISSLPKLIAVQYEGYTPLITAMEGETTSSRPSTRLSPSSPPLADGIAISNPIRKDDIVKALHESGGGAVAVTDEEIEEALATAGLHGFFIEPTAAVGLAGAKRYIRGGVGRKDEVIVTVFTGHGLKSAGHRAVSSCNSAHQ